jgi:hypothetical protein
MNPKSKMVIGEWKPSHSSRTAAPYTGRNFVTAVLGSIGTLLLHVLLFSTFDVTFKGRYEELKTLSEEGSLVLSLIAKPPRSDEIVTAGVPPLRLVPTNVPILIEPPKALKVHRLELDAEESSSIGPVDPEIANANAIYQRQIIARVGRIWRSAPYAAANTSTTTLIAPAAGCQAQLEQDEKGNVKEVLLVACEGSPEWRASVLAAIRESSPLPAPPDPRVFRQSIVLDLLPGLRLVL